jgi:non-specific protein-tyrosine kinase
MASDEAFARLRDEIWVRSGGALPGVLLVASARRGEGRTSVAVGLARALADSPSDRTVLLVDGDLRSPKLHEVFGAPISPGLSDVLGGSSDLGAALQSVDSGRARLLPAGRQAGNACMLIASERMSKLVDELRSQAATVIVDSPPTESGAEATSLAGLADAVLLVVRSDRTERKAALNACDQLGGTDKDRILGVVLSDTRLG